MANYDPNDPRRTDATDPHRPVDPSGRSTVVTETYVEPVEKKASPLPLIIGILLASLFPDSWGLALAGTLGLEVVAEGIETESQRDLLLELGCTRGQGFLYSQARPAAEWRAMDA